MRKKFHDLLHQYKVEAFKISHNKDHVDERTKEILQFTEQALNHEFHYHFRRSPNPQRADLAMFVKNFTLEAILPPILEKLVERIVVLEKQHHAMVDLVDHILEALSEPEAKADASAS